VIVVLGTVAAMLAWSTTVAWHVADRAKADAAEAKGHVARLERAVVQRVIAARSQAIRSVASLFSRMP